MSKNIAIITGASSGIGKAFLEEIVKEHGAYGCVPFDEIWAVARREDKLIEIKTLLGEDRIVPVVADLSSPEDMTVLADRLALEKPQIGLLINCAGIGMKGLVEDHPAKALEDTIDVNCTSQADQDLHALHDRKDSHVDKRQQPEDHKHRIFCWIPSPARICGICSEQGICDLIFQSALLRTHRSQHHSYHGMSRSC